MTAAARIRQQTIDQQRACVEQLQAGRAGWLERWRAESRLADSAAWHGAELAVRAALIRVLAGRPGAVSAGRAGVGA